MHPRKLSGTELIRSLEALVAHGNKTTATILTHLAEVDRRRLYLEHACPSMFAYCTQRLRMSEGAACRRIAVARLSRTYPQVLEHVARGELHLTAIALLKDHLTQDNADELFRAAMHKSKREVEKLVAALAPQPVPAPSIRKLPAASQHSAMPDPPPPAAVADGTPSARGGLQPTAGSASGPDVTASDPSLALRPARRHVQLKPLSAQHYKLTVVLDEAARAKLQQIQELRRPGEGRQELSCIVDEALDLLLAKLRKQRLGVGRTASKRTSTPRLHSRYIPKEVRKQVWERDQGRCAFVDEQGRRCQERTGLEFHHIHAFARGGPTTADNLALCCRPHNLLLAMQDFGAETIKAKISQRAQAP